MNYWDNEMATLKACHDVRTFLQTKQLQTPHVPLDPRGTYEDLCAVFRNGTLELLGWGDMFMMDMMYAKQGGNFKMDDYGRPVQGSTVMIQGKPHVVTCNGIFTFAAELDDDDESTEEVVYSP